MICDNEKEEIINAAVERCFLRMPEVIGNLMASHAMLHKINKKFYGEHPEFSQRRDIVQAVVESIEGDYPLDKYEDILNKAVPEIKRRMEIAKTINVESRPDRLESNFEDVDLSNNGVL
jgi:hypothetical protein